MGKWHRWLFKGHLDEPEGPGANESEHHHQQPWYKVMCLTGVDYFSTLGYQPGIAFLAAGALSPIATIVLVLVTLFGALPIYRRVAAASPHGEGSIAMLERLLPKWKGKLLVLCLLGFVATDFIITITLSAADATAHVIENPFVPPSVNHPIILTLLFVTLLAAIFIKGFKEAIGIAVVLVVLYLLLNTVVLGVGIAHVVAAPELLVNWKRGLFESHGNVFAMIGLALLLFPKLALGLSGFETGVAVMPLVKGSTKSQDHLEGRIKNTRKLIATAAIIMSVLLISSSFVTTLLIPAAAFQQGGAASGRALAYLAHQFLGDGFGTVYDIST
ncbi:MAG: amino acid transporter, partial [Candidatus Kapaibacterium sp.]